MFPGSNPDGPVGRFKIALLVAAVPFLAMADLAEALSREGERRIRESRIVQESVIHGLRSGDLVRVMVAFESSRGKSERRLGNILTGNRSLIANTGKSILGSLKQGEFVLRHRFEIIGARQRL